MDSNDEDAYRGMTGLLERPPAQINWNPLDANEADLEWYGLNAWVTWLKVTFGLPPSIVPPHWHRQDELAWELSALHTHWPSGHHQSANASAPIAWLRDYRSAARGSIVTARPCSRSGRANEPSISAARS